MNFVVGALAILSAVVLTAAAVSLFALHRAHVLLAELKRRQSEPAPAPAPDQVQELRDAVEAMAAQMREMYKVPAAAPLDPATPRPGLNLSKRSQALRLHRRGEAAGQIAAAIQVPRQEVDLLIKVHRIVLSTV